MVGKKSAVNVTDQNNFEFSILEIWKPSENRNNILLQNNWKIITIKRCFITEENFFSDS